jgi:hypothetical protein
LSNDPQFEEKVRDIAGQYLDPPERALVLCVDEKRQIHAPDRTAPILPLRPGLPERQTHDYKRYGTTTLFAAFNILNGKVIGAVACRVIAAKSSCNFSTKWRGNSLPTWMCTSFGQLQHAQERHRKAMAPLPKAPPLSVSLHPHQQFSAQSGGTLVRPNH